MTLATDLPRSPFTPWMVSHLGITARQLAALADSSEIRRVLTGVYLHSDVPDTLETRIAAARLVISEFSVVCDRTAAWLWGVDSFDVRELEILPPLECYVLRGHHRTRRPQCAGGERDLRQDEVVDLDGVAVTTPLRTATDLACKLGPRDGLAALDGFMRHHALTRSDYRRELLRYFRRRGVVRARVLAGWADGRAESPGESWTRAEILLRGLPVPKLQWIIEVDGREIYRLDLAYPRHRLAVEYDGREFHDSPDRREHDRGRRKWLEDRGWTIIVVTKDDFGLDAVDGWTDRIRTALRLAA